MAVKSLTYGIENKNMENCKRGLYTVIMESNSHLWKTAKTSIMLIMNMIENRSIVYNLNKIEIW